ncbi:hypothetical protein Nans01_34650 [Nocardiopsis ansamitocini]|uniref:HTH luxR-type domain-containing protein n=2 Tax=Nocardiopsis ansamitocini TaxID=1670832 RepID=A0A9W6UJR4_9ACTN|nr:hypothetical protein Nans01_34650 [Nocardiopsis ansamitocini]
MLFRAGGSPALALETLKGIKEEGVVVQQGNFADIGETRLPGRLYSWVDGILEQGPRHIKEFLAACAAVGEGADVIESVAPVVGKNREEIFWAAAAAYNLGILGRGIKIQFQSPIVHEIFWSYIPRFFPSLLAGGVGENLRISRVPDRKPTPKLTRQEMRLVLLTSEGYTNQQIARRLSISQHTVNYHLKKLFKKYEVNSRVRLARTALMDAAPLADSHWEADQGIKRAGHG